MFDPPADGAGDLLDQLAGCEAQIRALQARQLELIAEFAAGQRGGRPAGACEQTERAIGMEVAAALGASLTTGRARVGDARHGGVRSSV
jgi:hypothetical protein